MPVTTALAIYFIIWWVVLFAVLPFGVRNPSEAGETVEPGNDPGAPAVPALGRKLIWTTIVTTAVFAICWVVYVYRLATLDDLCYAVGVARRAESIAEDRRMSREFLITSLIVVASPGTGVLYTLAAGLSRGSRASIVAAFGCTLGIVPHMAAAIMGLAALLHTSALAFQIFKYLGVAYLLYMAWNTLREHGALQVEKEVGARSALQVTVTGILINILNPKLSIFFLAFLPQFVSARRAAPAVAHAGAQRGLHADDLRGVRRLRAVRRRDPRPCHLASARARPGCAGRLRRPSLGSAPSWRSLSGRDKALPVLVR